ncbi:hypothetical protein FRC03_003155 [Tulasnella sp. 419]|nr:hypothetical protein FRC03_003155 [Tulasnella sp. 419]
MNKRPNPFQPVYGPQQPASGTYPPLPPGPPPPPTGQPVDWGAYYQQQPHPPQGQWQPPQPAQQSQAQSANASDHAALYRNYGYGGHHALHLQQQQQQPQPQPPAAGSYSWPQPQMQQYAPHAYAQHYPHYPQQPPQGQPMPIPPQPIAYGPPQPPYGYPQPHVPLSHPQQPPPPPQVVHPSVQPHPIQPTPSNHFPPAKRPRFDSNATIPARPAAPPTPTQQYQPPALHFKPGGGMVPAGPALTGNIPNAPKFPLPSGPAGKGSAGQHNQTPTATGMRNNGGSNAGAGRGGGRGGSFSGRGGRGGGPMHTSPVSGRGGMMGPKGSSFSGSGRAAPRGPASFRSQNQHHQGRSNVPNGMPRNHGSSSSLRGGRRDRDRSRDHRGHDHDNKSESATSSSGLPSSSFNFSAGTSVMFSTGGRGVSPFSTLTGKRTLTDFRIIGFGLTAEQEFDEDVDLPAHLDWSWGSIPTKKRRSSESSTASESSVATRRSMLGITDDTTGVRIESTEDGPNDAPGLNGESQDAAKAATDELLEAISAEVSGNTETEQTGEAQADSHSVEPSQELNASTTQNSLPAIPPPTTPSGTRPQKFKLSSTNAIPIAPRRNKDKESSLAASQGRKERAETSRIRIYFHSPVELEESQHLAPHLQVQRLAKRHDGEKSWGISGRASLSEITEVTGSAGAKRKKEDEDEETDRESGGKRKREDVFPNDEKEVEGQLMEQTADSATAPSEASVASFGVASSEQERSPSTLTAPLSSTTLQPGLSSVDGPADSDAMVNDAQPEGDTQIDSQADHEAMYADEEGNDVVAPAPEDGIMTLEEAEWTIELAKDWEGGHQVEDGAEINDANITMTGENEGPNHEELAADGDVASQMDLAPTPVAPPDVTPLGTSVASASGSIVGDDGTHSVDFHEDAATDVGKTDVAPSAKPATASPNRISISYAGSSRRLVMDSDVVEHVKIWRMEGKIEVVLLLQFFPDGRKGKEKEDSLVEAQVLGDGDGDGTIVEDATKAMDGNEADGNVVAADSSSTDNNLTSKSSDRDEVVNVDKDADPAIHDSNIPSDPSLMNIGNCRGILVDAFDEASQTYVAVPYGSPGEDATIPPFHKYQNMSADPIRVRLLLFLDKDKPLSEPKWVKTGDIEEWLKNIFGQVKPDLDTRNSWNGKIHVVDPDPPPTIYTVIDNWAQHSLVGPPKDRRRFVREHLLNNFDNVLEILLRLVRGERATPSNNQVSTSGQNHLLGTPLAAGAVTASTSHAAQQTHVSLAVLSLFRIATEYAVLAGVEEKKVENQVGELVRQLPQHLVYKSLDGIFREWMSMQKNLRQQQQPPTAGKS